MKKNNCSTIVSSNKPLRPETKGKYKMNKKDSNRVKTMFYHKR